nr:Na+/H+ antiporter NhaA [Pseudonocardia nigra]
MFMLFVQRRGRAWRLLLPLAVITCVLVDESGVARPVAGVLLGFTVPVIRAEGPGPGPAEQFVHRFRPLPAGVRVVRRRLSIGGAGGLGAALVDSVALGAVVGLVVGRTIGVLGLTWLVPRSPAISSPKGLSRWDVLGLALLAGVGFTVSLLIGVVKGRASDAVGVPAVCEVDEACG